MIVNASLSSLKDTRPHELLLRFVLGGFATVLTGLIALAFGPAVGGLFLALPAIFCASATLIERHEIRRKGRYGMPGRRRGQDAAALDAVGAACGSVGLIAFAIVFASTVTSSVLLAFAAGIAIWGGIAVAMWYLRGRLRLVRKNRHPTQRISPRRRADIS